MTDVEKEIEKNKDKIAEAIKKTGTAQIYTTKDGLKVASVRKEVIK